MLEEFEKGLSVSQKDEIKAREDFEVLAAAKFVSVDTDMGQTQRMRKYICGFLFAILPMHVLCLLSKFAIPAKRFRNPHERHQCLVCLHSNVWRC